MTAPLLSWGTNYRWYCDRCGRVFRKAQHLVDGNRFHSSRCIEPLKPVAVMVTSVRWPK